MSEEDQFLALVQYQINSLPEEERGKVTAAHTRLRGVITETGGHGILALALLSAEIQLESARGQAHSKTQALS